MGIWFLIPAGSGHLNKISESGNRRVQVFKEKIRIEGTCRFWRFQKLQRIIGLHERTGKDLGDYFRLTFDFFCKIMENHDEKHNSEVFF
jgi:hypothetical protein